MLNATTETLMTRSNLQLASAAVLRAVQALTSIHVALQNAAYVS